MLSKTVLPESYGYGFAVGIGAAFALLLLMISRSLSKFMGEVQNSERFSTASRSVRSGLIASATVSAWTWPATLLTSGEWAYSHGISGPFFYAIGGAIQVIFFVFLAIQIKKNSPGCHTIAQLIRVRFGKSGHVCYLCYCVATNVLISSLLLLGGSQGFSQTTGMHIVAACLLLPTGVCVYTLFGGLKATFISDWIHTVIIYLVICVSCFKIYTCSDLIGSPGKMWDLLREAQKAFPSATGQNYLNFKDRVMVLETWSIMLGGLASVFGDPGYSQRAIASDSTSVFYGYCIGGACWLIVPWLLGSSAGLACRALLTSSRSVTYPKELSKSEVASGMPIIYGLADVLGKGGAASGLLMLFMSVTSATSAELIAFSSITTYDIYQTYVNPKASGKNLISVSHGAIIAFSFLMAILAIIFNYADVTLSWLLNFCGVILNPEVGIISLAIFWKRMSSISMLIGGPLGTMTGIACWIGSAYHFGGKVVTKDSLMTSEATFIGNITSLVSTVVYVVCISLVKPQNFHFGTFASSFRAADDADIKDKEAMQTSDKEKIILRKQFVYAIVINAVLLLGAYIILPISYYGSNYTFSKKYFTQWIIVMMVWLVAATIYIIVFPLWQGRESILKILRSVLSGSTSSGEILNESYNGEVTFEKTKSVTVAREVEISEVG